jgi:hypothetical protein
MINHLSRRHLLKFAGAILPLASIHSPTALLASETSANPPRGLPIADVFPSHPPELVREMVTVSHFDFKRVRELIEARPALARAAWDWGFGDWEDALGAASHMGNRPIAEYLIQNGARPSLFSAAMLGQLEVVKALLNAHPHAQRIRGPHGISLLTHAQLGGDDARPVFNFLQSLGDAAADSPVPLTEKDTAALAGTYVFGVGVTQQVEITVESRALLWSMYSPLTWTRKGTMGRPLIHVGDRSFYPAGAPAARIRFTEDSDGVVMTVHDPDLVLTAKRSPPEK